MRPRVGERINHPGGVLKLKPQENQSPQPPGGRGREENQSPQGQGGERGKRINTPPKPPRMAKDGKSGRTDLTLSLQWDGGQTKEGTMARKATTPTASKPEQTQGRFCPICGATLNLSKFQRYYCPNVYPPRGAAPEVLKAFTPCAFKGYRAGATTAVNSGEDIAPLANPSDEQSAIMERAERWGR